MQITKPIAFLDFEATHADPVIARAIEIGVSVVHPDGRIEPNGWTKRFNPGISIPPESTKIHGITDADVKDCLPFSSIAQKLSESLKGKDIAGYNVRSYDCVLLDCELRRCGLKLDLEGVSIIDCFGIFSKKCPRDLSAAVEYFCGVKHEGAHGAGADTKATVEVFLAQLKRYEDLAGMPMPDLAAYSVRGDNPPVDLQGKFYRDADGDLVYTFGKHKDVKVRKELGFARWMMDKDFAGNTLDALQAELERIR